MPLNLCVPDSITVIRTEMYLGRGASAQTLARIEALVQRFPESPDLWVLRGDAIQLSDGTGPTLAEARKSYQRALALDPSHREAAEEIREFDEMHGSLD